ncbi:MAG: HEAT repeat domain-containing protein [Betaproteobacteria bacterium]|nr:HEAT repeat domain-containing protein [Betaproteobacteria bacterium]
MNRLPIFVLACTLACTLTTHAQDADKLFRQWAEERMQILVKEKDPKERAKAAEYLGGSKYPDANAALGVALSDSDVSVRAAAAAALWKSGKGAEPARAQLMKALDDPAPQVAMNAAGALQTLGVKPEELVPARQRALAAPDASRYIRFIAARGLIDLAPPLSLLEPMLAFLDQSAASRSDAGKHNTGLAEKALANLVETKDRALIPPLQEALQRAQHGQAVLLKTLAKFEPKPDAFTATLLPFLDAREPAVREAALDLLGAQRNEDDVSTWAPRVAAMLSDADRNVRWRAAWNLGKPGGLAAREIDRLVTALSDSDVSVRRAAARSIGEIGEAKQAVVAIAKNNVAERARPALMSAAEKDSDSEVRSAASEALKKLVEKPLPIPPNASAEAAGMRLLRERDTTFESGGYFRALTAPDVPLIRAFLDGGMSVSGDLDGVGPPLRAALFGGRGCSPKQRPTKAEVKHMLRLLIERGADVNAGDTHGNTPLSEAASKGCDRETIKILLAAGAKIGATNAAGLTAFEMGLYSGHDGLEELIAAGYRLTPEKAKAYAQGYAANPAALALIKKATKK